MITIRPIEYRFPDFLVIGAPKAGTTTLATDLSAHPRLWLPMEKELGYFDVRWQQEPLDAYGRDFAAAPPGRIVGEATPTYLHRPGAVERIADCLPDVRLVVVLRDPASRAWSHYWYNRSARAVEALAPEDAFAEHPREYVEPGRYAAHLSRVLQHFDRDQLHVLTLDEMVADAPEAFRAVCRHLGVEQVVPPDVGRPRNRAYSVRSPYLRRQMRRLRLWKRLPFGLGFRLDELNRVQLQVPPMPDHLRAALGELYAEDTTALELLLGRSLPWSADERSTDEAAP